MTNIETRDDNETDDSEMRDKLHKASWKSVDLNIVFAS